MQFTTSVLSLITLAVSVSAHGHLAAPPALPNTTPFQVMIPFIWPSTMFIGPPPNPFSS